MSLLNLENGRSGEMGVSSQVYEGLLQKRKSYSLCPLRIGQEAIGLDWLGLLEEDLI